MSINRSPRYCQYVVGFDKELGETKVCGSRTSNLIGKIAICVYHAQFSKPLREWPD